MLRLLLVVPILQIALFGFALSNETRNIRMAVFSKPSDSMFRKFNDKAMASGWFTTVPTQGREPFEIVQSGAAEVAVVVDTNGLDYLLGPSDSSVQILINAVNTTRASSINSYVQSILNSTLNDSLAGSHQLPIQIIERVFYNPQSKTSFFLIPGLMGTMICMITVLVTSMSITKEKEIGTFETIISAPVSKAEVLIGKALPTVVMGIFNLLSILLLAILLFKMPFQGLLGVFLLVGSIYVICTVSIGVLISTLCSTQQQAMMASFLFIFPSMMLSGLMFPVENMPDWMIVFSELNPMTHFIYVMRNIMLKGGNVDVIILRGGIILAMTLAFSGLAYRAFKTRLN